MLAERLKELRPTAVNSVLAEVRAVQAGGASVVSLMRGEPDFPTPQHIVEAATASLRAGRTSYPENRGEPRLREAVARKLERENGARYDAGSEILITDGATLGLYAALMAVVDPGDEVLLPDPVYDAYYSPIRLAGAVPVYVQSTRNQRFELTVDALEAAWTPRSRVLLLNTPWNPVGTVFSAAELERIADFATRKNLTLISDEIYEAITYDGARHTSPASMMRDRCILINSFSKTFSMTGWRVGYCAAPKPVIDAMLLVLQQSSRGPATFIQDAGAAALDGPADAIREMQAVYTQRRQAVADALAGIPGVRVISPEGGFFSMVEVAGRSSDDLRRHLLQKHGVVVMHGRAYGECGEGTLRVSFAKGGDTLERGLELLRKGLLAL